MRLLAFVACCAAAPGCHASPDETGALPTRSDPGWTTGAEEPCDAPIGEPRWRDASDILRADGADIGATSNGPVALGEIEGRTWVVALDGANTIASWTLDGEARGARTLASHPVRLGLQDIDGDGALDLWTDGDTVEVAWSFATADEARETVTPSTQFCIGLQEMTVFDADGDGDRDLLYPTGLGCVADDGEVPGLLLRNQGDRTFGAPEPIDAPTGFWGETFDVVVDDFDDDADPDAYLCNDHGPETAGNGFLFNDGSGVFAAGDPAGADVTVYCMSASRGDLDGDGRLDLYVAALAEQLALVATDQGYVDQAASLGLATFSGTQMPWGSAVVDADNDGLVDVVLTTSPFTGASEDLHPMLVEHQVSPGEWALESAPWGLPQETRTRALLARDLNADGAVDLVAADFEDTPWLLLSEGCTAGSWVEVSAPSGSRVTVEGGGRMWTALATDDPGFGATGPSVAHIGLGDVDAVDRVTLSVPWLGEQVLVGPISARRRLAWSRP